MHAKSHRAVKTLTIIALVLLYLFAAAGLACIPAGRAGRRRFLTGNASFFARRALAVLGIRVMKRSRRRTADTALIVSNHLSSVDILVIASVRPAVFITSVELRNSFPLGLLAFLGGSIFVERRNPSGLRKEIRDIARTLAEGTSVVLFPEGTTFDGRTVRPFKSSLFTAAVDAGTMIQPCCIRYRRINGKRIGPENADAVYYHGGTTFAAHAPRLLGLRSVHVELITLDAIAPADGRSRKELAELCHERILRAYHRT